MIYDGLLDIATGRTRKETRWRNKTMQWSELAERLATTHHTHETVAEYARMPKSQQDSIKDIGGFVGGLLTGGRRKAGSVLHRQLLTLDLDNATPHVWDSLTLLYPNAALVYSTHKHTPSKPRLRLLMPLDRPVSPEEYEAIGRRIAGDLGINMFDRTGYQPYRLMYWPSTSKDGVYYYQVQDGEWLIADEVLGRYKDWSDSSEWPIGDTETEVVLQGMKLAGDPLEKPGVVGAWCRTYSIDEALELLSDVYEPSDIDSRWSYKGGSTGGGLVTYEGKWAYSHHGTDPAGGKLLNAFDLVRVHLYGHLDARCQPDIEIQKRPSYAAMIEHATKDVQVRQTIGEERLQAALEDFADETTEDSAAGLGSIGAGEGGSGRRGALGMQAADLIDELEQGRLQGGEDEVPGAEDADLSWLGEMDVDGKGAYRPTVENHRLILENDPLLKGRVRLNLLEHREIVVRHLPWRRVTAQTQGWTDKDDSALRGYIEKVYGLSAPSKLTDAMNMMLMDHSYHPVRDYLSRVSGEEVKGSGIGAGEGRSGVRGWDGVPRVDTLLIDYLDAEDTPYVRAVTRKTLVAAVARAFRPGCKFDYVLTLTGPEGIGKSTLISKLGGPWFSDNFNTVIGKESYEQLAGVWIVEMCEMAGLKKAEVEHIKHFVSKQQDRLRVAFGKRVESFPRQCVFFATTNDDTPLRGDNGNRRFWVVEVGVSRRGAEGDGGGAEARGKSVWTDLDSAERDQIWAEAVALWKAGERLTLGRSLETEARAIQAAHTESDGRQGLINKYLDMLLPESWPEMSVAQRRQYIEGYNSETGKNDSLFEEGCSARAKVCALEIWCELMGGRVVDLTARITKEINSMILKNGGWEKSKSATYKTSLYGTQRCFDRKIGKNSVDL